MDTSSEISSNFTVERSLINLGQIFDTSLSQNSSSTSISNELNYNEEDLQCYLTQFQVDCYWNPSDDSDFEDTSYEFDMLYETEKQQENAEKQWQEEEITKKRKTNMKRYFDDNKNKMSSIFNLKGIKFTHFNYKFINFIFTPSAFCKKYICAHRKYCISLIYKNKWWNLKRFQVPNKSEVLEFFMHTNISDKALMKVIDKIYRSLVRVTQQQIKARKHKHKKYLLGKEVYFNSDDEKLLLTPEERERRREKIKNTWNRMLPPNTKQ